MIEYIWESFTYIFKDKNWKKKLVKGGAIGVIPLLNISLLGYMVDMITLIYKGKNNELPEFDISSQFIDGFKISAVLFVYFILFYILLIVILGIFSVIFKDNIFSVIGIVCFAIFMLFMHIAFSHYIYTNKISSFFEFTTLFRILKKTWVNILIFDIIYYIIMGFLAIAIYIMAALFSMTIILIPVAIWLLGAFYYYSCIVFGYFCGKVYLEGINKKPITMGSKVLPTKTVSNNNKDLNLLNSYLLGAKELLPGALDDFRNNNLNDAIKKWNKSLEYYKKAEKIAKSNKDEELISSLNNNIKSVVHNILDAKIKLVSDKIGGMV
ncbi:DUF4013 domain-containing protein [Methanothermococcus thermolithotrophicus]|uniref:DUF4013 domain-containing protein n=1 Tax=Methanothermococcus thermolithotrophicus TaxID=2186 RepID=UPI00038200FE|nr:DUF4013 domain-containing protein [Methanothermococcus thermolithotrophicus]